MLKTTRGGGIPQLLIRLTLHSISGHKIIMLKNRHIYYIKGVTAFLTAKLDMFAEAVEAGVEAGIMAVFSCLGKKICYSFTFPGKAGPTATLR